MSTIACTGAKTAPRVTTHPLTRANIRGIQIIGLYGRGSCGSRTRRTMAPTMVKKKNVYSARPLKVTRARKFPKKMYTMEQPVEKRIALMGASAVEADCLETEPTRPRNEGNQFELAAATTMRPATNELPSKDPATTRQMRPATVAPNAGPRRWLNDVCDECQPVKLAHFSYQ